MRKESRFLFFTSQTKGHRTERTQFGQRKRAKFTNDWILHGSGEKEDKYRKGQIDFMEFEHYYLGEF